MCVFVCVCEREGESLVFFPCSCTMCGFDLIAVFAGLSCCACVRKRGRERERERETEVWSLAVVAVSLSLSFCACMCVS